MPSFCGLPCCSSKDKRHPEENVVEKPVYVAVPVQTSTIASVPTTQTKAISTTTPPLESNDNQATVDEDTKVDRTPTPNPLSEKTEVDHRHELPASEPTPELTTTNTEDMNQLKGATSGVTDTVSSGAQQVSSGAQSAASTAQTTASSGAEQLTSGAQSATGQSTASTGKGNAKWDAMTEDQKKATYDALPAEKKHDLTYYEWIKQGYHNSMENWMPWVEDMYLRWFTKDNKASYATKDALDKSKVTGIEQVDTLQDGVHNVVAGQVGQGGLLQPVGDMVSKEGVNRAERGGKDDSGSYAGAIGSTVSGAGGSLWSGAKSAGGYVGGMFSGGKTEQAPAEQK